MAEIQVNGETLRYERAGAGPPLLLIHSLGTGAWLWREQMQAWSQDFDVLAFDARGHGGSTHNGPVSVEAIAADLEAALQALGVGPVHVVAISMGGPIAARLWALAPGRIASLVIADSFARQGPAGEQRVRDLEQTLATTSMADYGRSYAKGALHPQVDPAHADALAASVAGMSKDAYLETARSVFTSDVAELMASIDVPVHVVVGAQDARTPPRLSEEIVGLIPHAGLEVIDPGAHLANLDNPEGFHAAVHPFLINASRSGPRP